MRTTKRGWMLRRLGRRFDRTYKGLTDVFGFMCLIAGCLTLMFGVMLVLCAEWSSVFWLTLGAFGVFEAFEFFGYGRRK